MEINAIIAENLNRLRLERNMSLGQAFQVLRSQQGNARANRKRRNQSDH